MFFLIIPVMSCTLHFDALVTEFFKIYLVMSKHSGEGTLSKVFFDVSKVRWGVSLVWVPSE